MHIEFLHSAKTAGCLRLSFIMRPSVLAILINLHILSCTSLSSTISGYAATFYKSHLHSSLYNSGGESTWADLGSRHDPAASNCRLYCQPYMQTFAQTSFVQTLQERRRSFPYADLAEERSMVCGQSLLPVALNCFIVRFIVWFGIASIKSAQLLRDAQR